VAGSGGDGDARGGSGASVDGGGRRESLEHQGHEEEVKRSLNGRNSGSGSSLTGRGRKRRQRRRLRRGRGFSDDWSGHEAIGVTAAARLDLAGRVRRE
jgi:hypothetical protein